MLRHDYDHNVPSAWIGMPLAAFAAILFGEIGFMMSGYSINPGSFADTFYVVLASFFILSIVLMATFMFDKMSGRYGQISYLTLPATNLEKFLVNLLETVVSTIVFFIIGMVLAGTLLAGLLIIIITAKTHESTSFVSIADTFYSWFALVLTMGGMIAASTVLNPISDKPGSTEFLTLPATNVEKFLSRVTIVTLGFALSALVSLVAVGALYYLLAAIFGLDAYGSLTFYCLKVLFTPAQMIEGPAREAWSWQGTLASYGFLVCLQSMFMLGGSVWRRFPLVKTLGVVVALAIILPPILVHFSFHPQTRSELVAIFPTILATTGSILLAIAIINGLLSYWLFTRKQVVETKKHLL